MDTSDGITRLWRSAPKPALWCRLLLRIRFLTWAWPSGSETLKRGDLFVVLFVFNDTHIFPYSLCFCWKISWVLLIALAQVQRREQAPCCASAFFSLLALLIRKICPGEGHWDLLVHNISSVIALGRRKRGMAKLNSRKTRPNSRREEPFYPRTSGEGQKRSCYWTIIYSFISFAQGGLQFYHRSLQCFTRSVLILCAFLPTPITSHTPT